MKEIIKVLFTENQFKISELASNSVFATCIDNQKANYYLVLFLDDISEVLENKINFNKYYENIMQLEEYNHQMDKNLSMVICVRRNTLRPNEEVNQAIYQIEEDPYFFKKYVLTYTQEQIEAIHQEDNDSATQLSMKFIYNFLYDHDKFLAFKLNPYEESVYNLVSKIFIKFPFLNLRNTNQQMDNLSERINQLLNTEQIELRNKALLHANNLEGNPNTIRQKVMSFLGVNRDGNL